MSSLFGALDTSVSGLNAQSAAFGNLSDNIANSQTTGFKRTDTNFTDYLTTSTATTNDSGVVLATPDYRNDVQGTINTSDNPLALAISGSGFFQVAQETASPNGGTTVSTQPEYTRDGSFTLDKNGYLVTSSGNVLSGWNADPTTGVINQNLITPIKINQSPFSPVPTSAVTLNANLPATPASNTPVTSQVNVYDAQGTLHTVTLAWTQNANNNWTVALSSPDATTPNIGGAQVEFGDTSGNPVPAGTIGSITNTTGGVAAPGYSANGAASLTFTANFGSGAQPITLNLGNYGQPNGLTQYAGTSYTVDGLTQNGVPPGHYSGITAQANGNVVVDYDNGQSRIVAQVPLTTFANPDALQRQDGQAFTATLNSGIAIANASGSNVDIASEFTQLIVAQQAYSANAKVITTANTLLQTTINIIQ